MAYHVAVVKDDDDGRVVSVPTLDAFLALAKRVEELEAQAFLGVPDAKKCDRKKCDHRQDNREFTDGSVRCMVCGTILKPTLGAMGDGPRRVMKDGGRWRKFCGCCGRYVDGVAVTDVWCRSHARQKGEGR